MTSNLPSPPISPNVDLRDFPFTPLFRSRLFGSEFHAHASDGAWRAGVTLWLKSWDQTPAGSLPDDEIALCRLAELGKDVKTWRKVKDWALHGWFKCSDGRLYHKVVAEGINEAWDKKNSQRDRTAAARAVRQQQRLLQTKSQTLLSRNADDEDAAASCDNLSKKPYRNVANCGIPKNDTAPPDEHNKAETSKTPQKPSFQLSVTDTATDTVTDPVTASKGQYKRQLKEERDSPPNDAIASLPPPMGAEPPKPSRQRPAKPERATYLPADWLPTAEDCEFAEGLELDPADVTPEFCDYWHGESGQHAMKRDWSATYRNRCRYLANHQTSGTVRNGQQKLSAATKLYVGGRLAADQLDAEDAEHEAREGGFNQSSPFTLLDGGRSGPNPPSTNRRLAGGSG